MTYDIVQDLKKNPEDNEVWLFYSDTLLRQGNPLGELIGLEHRLFFSEGPLEDSYRSALMEAREKARDGVEEDLKKKGVSRVLDWYHGLPHDVDFNGNDKQRTELVKWNPFTRFIETIQGDYKAFSKLVPGTRRHVDELWKDRLVMPELRDQFFYPSDGAVYFLSKDGKSQHLGGEPYFALTREGSNPLLKNLDEACKQLRETRNYRVPEEDLESALADPETEVFELSKLGMNIYSNMRSYLELSTENFKLDHLNDDQRRLIHRVYGKDNFDGIMSIDEIITRRFGKRWIRTRTYVLNPDYVREHASAGAIGRASWLGNGNFDAVDFNINIRFRLRGVVSSERSES